MGTLSDQQRAFLRENAFAGVATTLRADGSPHTTIVWVDEDNGDVMFNTARGRAKAKHLESDPRASVLMVDPNDSFKYVTVSGPAELTEDGADAHIDHLAKKYMGVDEYPYRDPSETRVIVRVKPEKVTASGL
jgi:PPOX class probable F420-dependent enzyme